MKHREKGWGWPACPLSVPWKMCNDASPAPSHCPLHTQPPLHTAPYTHCEAILQRVKNVLNGLFSLIATLFGKFICIQSSSKCC